MQYPDQMTQSTQSNPMRRKRWTVFTAILVVFLLIAELGLQLALRLGWKTYRGLDTVSAIAVDRKGQAWVTGYWQGLPGLMKYSESDQAVEVPLPVEPGWGSPSALMIDSQDRVWLGTEGGKLAMLAGNGDWTVYSSVTEEDVRQIVMDGQGQVWVRSHRGPAKIDPDSGERTFTFTDPALIDHIASALAIDPQGQLWVLTWQRELRTLEADGSWRTVMLAPASVRNGFADAFLAFDPQGQMWMATVQGVGVLSPDGAWEEHLLGDPSLPLSLFEVISDARGRVWVAAFQPRSSGVFLFDPQAGWTNYTNRNSGIAPYAAELAVGLQGQAWIGSQSGRLSQFNPNGALSARSISTVYSIAMALGPVILLTIALLAILLTTPSRPGVSGVQSRKEIAEFALGFAGWFVVAVLLWVILRASAPANGLMFINPLVLIAPLAHVLLLIVLFAKRRRAFSGAISALAVNWIALLWIASGAEGSLSGSAVGTIFMVPFFLTG